MRNIYLNLVVFHGPCKLYYILQSPSQTNKTHYSEIFWNKESKVQV